MPSIWSEVDCVCRLIEEGADTSYAWIGGNASIIWMTVRKFVKEVTEKGDGFLEEGAVIRTIELLLKAGAPGHIPQYYNKHGSKTANWSSNAN